MQRTTFKILATLPVVLATLAACGVSAPVADVTHAIRLDGEPNSAVEPMLDELAGLLPPAEEAAVAVAMIDNGEVSYGFVGNPDVGRGSLFEFGSVTKVLTSNVLAQLAGEGVVSLDDSVNLYLPADLQGERWDDVTLENLATHTAGLPRLPSNLNPILLMLQGRFDDPYAGYDLDMLHEGLREVEPDAPGGEANYSNLGAGWLGSILAQVAGQSYPEMVRERIFEPLGMTSATAAGWSSDTIAPPLDGNGRPVSEWNMDALAGAGAARGSIEDAAAFLVASMAACSADAADAVARANCLTQQPTGYHFADGDEMGLGWIRTTRDGETVIWHNGGTGGFRTFLGFNPERQAGIVLLSNVGGLDALDGLGMDHLFGE